MGTKNNPGEYDCYENAEPDEPMFVLLARDALAPDIVLEWANAYIHKSEQANDGNVTQHALDKAREALQCAHDMNEWRKANRPERG